MISVIVPVYNVEKYLGCCIDSIAAQTWKDLEIILVDDGSTDASGAICDAYAGRDSRIKVIHKKNGGMSSARNAGLEIAAGEYVGFVDSDDFIMPDMYEVLYRACVEHHAALSVCGNRVIDENGRVLRYEFCTDDRIMLSAEEAIEGLLTREKCDPVAWNKLYRKELFSGIRYPAGVCYEDQSVTVRLFHKAGTVYHVGQALYVYRIRSGSITHIPFGSCRLDDIKQAELLKRFVDRKYPQLKKKSRHYVVDKICFAVSAASRCHIIGNKEAMIEAGVYGTRCFFSVMGSRMFTIKYKAWFCVNYIMLWCRVGVFSIGANSRSDKRKGES